MNYFVIAADGQKYGPADLQMLNQWAREGRVLNTSMLEDAATGQQILASTLPGLVFPAPNAGPTTGFQNPPSQQFYGNGYGDNGSEDVRKAKLFAYLSLLPCCTIIFGIIAIVFASNSQKKGHPESKSAMTLAVGCLVGSLLFWFIVRLILVAASHSIR